jgi:oligopeptide/dipeptide ABC transporter ATP-binding protein
MLLQGKGMTKLTQEQLVEVSHLKKYFNLSKKRKLHAVDDVSFKVYQGETLGLVGESGCGKSTIGNVVMRLLPKTDGELLFRGRDVFKASQEDKLEYCRKMQIIFQDPYSSLNPRKIVKSILSEAYIIHRNASFKSMNIETLVKDLCEMVEIPHNLLDQYPHELDGGMRQVVGIARALSLGPEFIVCDEPVSSLDVSAQARIVNLLIDIQRKENLSYLFISHDLSVVRHISDRIAVMYLGQIVEMTDTDTMFQKTIHPYSIALLSAVPRISVDQNVSRIVLKGDVPSPVDPKPGCRFAPRCWMAKNDCFTTNELSLKEVEPGHYVSCLYSSESVENAKLVEKHSLNILN